MAKLDIKISRSNLINEEFVDIRRTFLIKKDKLNVYLIYLSNASGDTELMHSARQIYEISMVQLEK